jgi:lipid-binding SYLF domain-containing protein
MNREIQKAAFTLLNLDDVATGPASWAESPSAALAGAAGVVFLTVATAGFIVSGRVGSGLVVGRTRGGGWSAPSAVMLVGVGGGLQAGVEVADVLIVINSRDALQALCASAQLAVATKATATAGHAGRCASKSGLTNERGPGDQPVSRMRVFSKSRGLFAGLALDTGLLISRSDINAEFYGSAVPVSELLLGRRPQPEAAKALYAALDAATANAYSKHSPLPGGGGSDAEEPNPFTVGESLCASAIGTSSGDGGDVFGIDDDELELSV